MKDRITAAETLDWLVDASLGRREPPTTIDVRSEGEFAAGSIPGFTNAPILRNEERHQVGTAYKREGSDAAIALGHELVAADRELRIDAWVDRGSASPIVACWRGGLRSKLACEWLRGRGHAPRQLLGGYKGVRRLLFPVLHEEMHPLVVVSGNTGSGKTRLLKEFAHGVGAGSGAIDLEGLARHRGSAFGLAPGDGQPAAATFENALALAVRIERARSPAPILVEDESRAIGSIRLPKTFHVSLTTAPIVLLEVPRDERVQNIYAEYVIAPLTHGFTETDIRTHLGEQLSQLRRRLGDARSREIQSDFAAADSPGSHAIWIEKLLEWYYDPMYAYGLTRAEARSVLFRGDLESCRAALREVRLQK